MSAGAPACCVKNTLCGTDPNAKVTISPTVTSIVPGVNVRDAVATTVLPGGGGGGRGRGGRCGGTVALAAACHRQQCSRQGGQDEPSLARQHVCLHVAVRRST